MEVTLRTKQLALAVALACAGTASQANVVLSEGFDNWAGLAASGWLNVNTSPSPGTLWLPGNPVIFPAASGAAASYASANFLGTTAASGPISNWLITPQIALDTLTTVSFDVRVVGQGLLDTVEVLVSTTGTAPANFSLIGSYSSSSADFWSAQSFSTTLPAAGMGYVAFRYVVADVATAGDYLGIDNVVITAVPEPATYVLLGMGIAALVARRRLSA